MTTDNTQELDEILALLGAKIPQPKTADEAIARVAMLQETRQAITDWHNKQVREMLDRLEKQAVIVTSLSGEKAGTIDLTAIEAERTRLRGDDE